MTTAVLDYHPTVAKQELQVLVNRALNRLRLQEAIRATVFALTAVLWALVPMLLLERLLSLSAMGIGIWVLWFGLLALCIPYVIYRAFSSGIHERFAAVLADERLGLHARLCTALTLDSATASPFSDAFYAEAAARLAKLDSASAFPIQTPRLAWLLPLPALLTLGVWYLVPQQDRMGFVAKVQEQRRAEDAGKRAHDVLSQTLVDLKAKEQAEVPAADSAQYKVKQMIKKAEDLTRELKEGTRDPKDAIIALAELKREIGEEKDKLNDGKDFAERMKELGTKELNLEESDFTRQVSEALKDGDAGLAAKEMRRLARKIKNEILGDEGKTPEQKAAALQKLKNEMEKLAGALADEEGLSEQLQELTRKSMEAGEYEALQEAVKKQLAKDGGKNSEQLAEDLEREINQAAEELDEIAEHDPEDVSAENQDAADQMEQLEESVEGAMEELNEQGPACEGGG